MKYLLFSLSLMLIDATMPLAAQQAVEEKARKVNGRTAYFIYTSMPEEVDNPMDLMVGTEVMQMTLSKRAVSDPVKIPADGLLRIIRKVEAPADASKPTYVTLAQVQVPETVTHALIILMPLAKPKDGLVFSAKVQDLAGFKGGDYLYMNLTNVDVGIEIGTNKHALKPGEVKINSAKVADKPEIVPVRYNYYHSVEKQWRMLSASTVVVQKSRREICIFSWDPRYDRIDYHGMTFPVDDNDP